MLESEDEFCGVEPCTVLIKTAQLVNVGQEFTTTRVAQAEVSTLVKEMCTVCYFLKNNEGQ